MRPDRKLFRRLHRAALFAAVRGLAYGTGSTAGGVIVWWIVNR
ncbi:hypothetical protein [Actinomadura hibisca]|nr:hypothetical protein [Actinomadura hibisca]